MGKFFSDIGENNYGDEGVLVAARHLSGLEDLRSDESKLGWEGVAVIASNLTKLQNVGIQVN